MTTKPITTTPGRHRAPEPDVDPVTRAVEALRAFTGGDPLNRATAWRLLASWAHRDTLTGTQQIEVVTAVTANADQRTAVTS